MKKKTFIVQLLDSKKPNRKSFTQVEDANFYSNDTDASLVFIPHEDTFDFETAKVVMYNRSDESLVERDAVVTTENGRKVASYELPEEIILHWGEWVAQPVFISGGEIYSGSIVPFSVARYLMDNRPPTLRDIIKVDELYSQLVTVMDEIADKDVISAPEIILARGGENTLGERLDKEHNEVTTQLAEKVGQGKKAELEDLSPIVLSAIEGGEGTSFNLLSIPQDKSVTEIKTTFINKSLNLFNADEQTIATIKDNHFVSGGVLYPDRPGYFVTAPIPVKSTTTYSVNEKIWGALGTAIAINTFSAEGVYRNGHNTQTFTTPTNCAYIQISVDKTLYSLDWIKNNFMLVEGNVIPTNYQAPGFFLNDNIQSERILAEVLKTKDNPKPLFVHISGETLKVNAKYSDTQDVRFNLAKRGVNNIFDFVNAQLVVRPSGETTSDMTSVASTLWSTGTDTFGPHVIRAVNNPDGDNHLATAFTGGNHGYDGGGNTGQSATGRTAEITFKVDGRKVQSFEGYAANVEVIWTNYIQGNNTRKSDGTGREILKETIKLFYDGVTWQVDYQSEMLEDVIYNTFYGLQLVTANYAGGIFYESSVNKKWNNNNNVASNSGDKKTSRFKVRDAAKINFVDVTIDKTIGLGMREYLSHDRAAFHTTNKAYMFLISSDTNLSTGDILTYKGSFRFYALS